MCKILLKIYYRQDFTERREPNQVQKPMHYTFQLFTPSLIKMCINWQQSHGQELIRLKYKS